MMTRSTCLDAPCKMVRLIFCFESVQLQLIIINRVESFTKTGSGQSSAGEKAMMAGGRFEWTGLLNCHPAPHTRWPKRVPLHRV
eukprot:COSAG06_NODE_1181_length_10363_cov_10.391563_11_plen_84_part_00